MNFIAELKDFWSGVDQRTRSYSAYILIALLLLVIGWFFLAAKTATLERKRVAREAVLKEILPLKRTYLSAKKATDMLNGQLKAVQPDDSPAKLIDEIGIKGKGVKILPVKGEQQRGFLEDAADIKVDGITANEAINLLYRLEKGNRPVVIKKSNLRVRFDDPSKVDFSITIALLKPAAVGQPK